jgi:GNAT superfamily N-acetyltransferase
VFGASSTIARMPASYKPMLQYRPLQRDELGRVREIDRTEAIETLYVQEGVSLREVHGDFSAAPWDPVGSGEHSVAAQRAELERYAGCGAICIGAFDDDRLVGIGVVRFHIRPGLAQLAYLHVSHGSRGQGVGIALAAELERLARQAGDTAMVVSATPSENTVRFYLNRGFTPMAEPLPELYELEPEDVHLEKKL